MHPQHQVSICDKSSKLMYACQILWIAFFSKSCNTEVTYIALKKEKQNTQK